MAVKLYRTRVRTRTVWILAALLIAAAIVFMGGCGALAPLGRLVQPPRFDQADDRPPELRIMAPSPSDPAGGAAVTLWLEVTNPNPFGFTISTLDTMLSLEGHRATSGRFPLGLPLGAGAQTIVPVELSIRFADVPGLAGVLRQAVTGRAVGYELEGTVGIDAGRFGQPTFGPMRMLGGELRVLR